MLIDHQYLRRKFHLSEMEHRYGENIHLLDDACLFTLLGKLCQPQCQQPMINLLVSKLYREMVRLIINREFPLVETDITSRMHDSHAEGKFKALMVDPSSRVVCVNLARAGTLPSQVCFDEFNYILDARNVRQDHISINRKTDASEKVVGTELGGVKIGGSVQDAYVLFPDPMGATGSTIQRAVEIYEKQIPGTPKKIIAVHLIVTPEYLAHVQKLRPKMEVYSIRLDRGLSPKHVLSTMPGDEWGSERGLNNKQYIVPGAGGVGEIINNSYV